jgi:hypothetical protein
MVMDYSTLHTGVWDIFFKVYVPKMGQEIGV